MDADKPQLIPLHLESICIIFMQLADRVNLALHTQIGDWLRIQEQNSGVLRMLESIHQRQVMEETIDHMVTLLTAAAVQSEDIPARAAIPVTYQEPTGQCGHSRIEINPSFLAYGLDLHGPKGLAPVAGVSLGRDVITSRGSTMKLRQPKKWLPEIEVRQVRIPQIDKNELQKQD
ncbi:hypothetical protein K438DRAFT_1779993 [Mycena galopus ATCC 62051]|nr:hypothetical protein K438DRAFT_1779993 [Mycena galopus ATCC 62051]